MKDNKRKRFIFFIFKVPAGYLGAVRTYKGIYSLVLPKRTYSEAFDIIRGSYSRLKKCSSPFKGLKKRLREYFNGKKVRFALKLDLDGFSDFDKRVFAVTSTIPSGQTRTYSWIAQAVGNSKFSRAVGQALSRNRLPVIIPCHRVIGKNDFGGFSYGVENKRMLLKAEGRLW